MQSLQVGDQVREVAVGVVRPLHHLDERIEGELG